MNETTQKMKKLNINVDKIIINLVLLMLILIPIAMRKIRIWSISPEILNSIYDTQVRSEFFNYFKFQILQFFTIIIFILFMYRTYVMKKKIRSTKMNSLLLILVITIILSSITSEYNYIALIGNSERFEGSLTWIYYLLIYFILYNIKIDRKYYKVFYMSLIIFLVINVLLGILNIYDINILENKFIYTILGSNSEIPGRLITTLYNQNFSSGIGAVIFIGSVTYALIEENKFLKIYSLFMLGMSFSLILTSMSLSGFVTIVFLSPIIVLLSLKFTPKIQVIKITSIMLLICTIIYIPLNNKDGRIYHETFGFFIRIASSIQTTLGFDSKDASDNKNLTEELESSGSGRVRIWKDSLKLIYDRPILGYGFDTFPFVIDQNNNGFTNVIVDKPHNWYLTTAYGSGIFALTSILSILIWISKNIIEKYKNKYQQKEIYVFFAMIMAYSFQGLFNDSFIGTSILLWIFMGVTVNRIVIENENTLENSITI